MFYLPLSTTSGSRLQLSSQFTDFWNTLTSNFGAGPKVLAWIGIVIIAVGVGSYLWQRRRGGGGNTKGLVWSCVLGGILAGPNILIPVVLGIIDLLIIAVVGILKAVFGI